jgi:hypothetical protein
MESEKEVTTQKLTDVTEQTIGLMSTRQLTDAEARYLTERDKAYHRRRLLEKLIYLSPQILSALGAFIAVMLGRNTALI